MFRSERRKKRSKKIMLIFDGEGRRKKINHQAIFIRISKFKGDGRE